MAESTVRTIKKKYKFKVSIYKYPAKRLTGLSSRIDNSTCKRHLPR